MNMNIEKGGITMNKVLTKALVVMNRKLSHVMTLYRMKCFALRVRKHLCFFVSTTGEESELVIIIIIS